MPMIQIPQHTNAPQASPKGLTQSQAEALLQKNGKNQLEQPKAVRPLQIFFNQYRDILTLILLCATTVSLFLGEYMDAITIAVIVIMNGVFGFLQEFKTERTLESLQALSAPTAKVYRDGVLQQIPAADVVVGDCIVLEAGDQVCADAILRRVQLFYTEEAILTGESEAQEKTAAHTQDTENRLHREDMVYMGTTVTKGHAEAQVVATGMQTQMGKIAHLLQSITTEQTQLQQKLAQLGKYIALLCLLVCGFVSVLGIVRGEPWMEMILTGLSLAVAAVPEGLPAIVTIALAMAVGRMVKKNALVRKLHSVETLGCTNVICSDKTGTLTQNNMTVTRLFLADRWLTPEELEKISPDPPLQRLLQCCYLCNNAVCQDGKHCVGEATEKALMELVVRHTPMKESWERRGEIPFDSKSKFMAVSVRNSHGESYCFLKGAYDVLLNQCDLIQDAQEVRPMTSADRQSIVMANQTMATGALRVLGIAYRQGQEGNIPTNHYIFLGLVGMVDPPRPQAKEAVALCRSAGIRTVMITGDHKTTACAIAKELGIYRENRHLALEGKDLDQMNLTQLQEQVSHTTVFARVSPAHKLKIVEALQQKGNVVAMTGDGVNDAPAIKQADIGVAMGKQGTDVTKQAADMVLLDDDFSTLVAAAKEGRVVYANIRKFMRYLFSCNIGEVVCMLLGMLLGLPVILLPIQILLVNLVTDGLPAIALGLEPAEPDLMHRPPRPKHSGLFGEGLFFKILLRGICIGISTLSAFCLVLHFCADVNSARTAAFLTLVVTQLINVLECKSETLPLYRIPLGNNKKLLLAQLVSVLVLCSVLFFPPLQGVFQTVALPLPLTLLCLLCCLLPTLAALFFTRRKDRS